MFAAIFDSPTVWFLFLAFCFVAHQAGKIASNENARHIGRALLERRLRR